MSDQFSTIFSAVTQLKVGVVGDFAVDMYYQLKKETGEISIETGKDVNQGEQPKTSLGGAGNVVKNVRALGVEQIWAFGVVGDDVWGRELLHLLKEQRVHIEHMLIQQQGWNSCAYIKPMMEKEEDHRLDFGSHNQPNKDLHQQLLQNLDEQLKELDILILNQQFVHPLLNESVVTSLNQLAEKHPHCYFIADMRQLGHLLRGITLKVNPKEMARMLKLSFIDETHEALCEQKAAEISQYIQAPVLLTRGENGMLFYREGKCNSMPGILQDGEIDSVGAGDTAISTFAVCLAAGASPQQALEIANMAAAVTVKKLYQTGTASPEEIRLLQRKASYLYNAYTAAYPQHAQYYQDSNVEIVESYGRVNEVRYLVIDHDGTISVLREGWEKLMHDMMLQCICGEKLSQLNAKQHEEISSKVDQLISQTTGAPTIVQMEGLVELIEREAMISAEEVLSPEAYKERYVTELNGFVAQRIQRFKKGELGIEEFTIKGVVKFLKYLKAQNISLYLASGTDEEYVIKEAEALEYALLFDGEIHGAKPDGVSAKRKVIEHLIREKNATQDQIVVLGDGPSEIREGRKVGALCVGVASDEVRRYGLNLHKRERLIRAGAHIIIPDFSQLSSISEVLFNIPKTELPISE